jgi:hypothetical protein
MDMVSMTWQEMFGNGARTGTINISINPAVRAKSVITRVAQPSAGIRDNPICPFVFKKGDPFYVMIPIASATGQVPGRQALRKVG